MYYKKLNINETEYALAVNIMGSGAPTSETEGVAGMLYMDDLTGDLYKYTAEGWVRVSEFTEGQNERIKALEDDVAYLKLPYDEIAISTFSANPSSAEKGSTVSSVALSWTVNKTPTALTFDGTAIDVNTTAKTVTGTFKDKKTWTLKATDERGATSTKTASLSFLNGVYYGVATKPSAYDSAFIRGLTKTLRSSKLTSFSVNAGSGQYIYYCLPESMGACTFTVGVLPGGFLLADTISYTNEYGHTEKYRVYCSENAGLGETTVSVS